MDRELRREQLTKYLTDKAKSSGGTSIKQVVEWILDFDNIAVMSETMIEARRIEMENTTAMKKLWCDAYVAGSGNYGRPDQARLGADQAVKGFDETFNVKKIEEDESSNN